MSLKQINWPALFNYNVLQGDMSDFQDGILDQLRSFLKENRSPGAISGLTVIPGTGLDVKVNTGLALFPDGKIGFIESQQTVALAAAHATLARVDRIEAEFALIDDRTGVNEDGDTVVVVKVHKVNLYAVTGVPNATPVAPVKTAGRISLGTVAVAPLATTINTSNITSSIVARDFANEITKFISTTIQNNQAVAVALQHVSVDKTKHKQIVWRGDVYRKDDAQEKTAIVRLKLSYKPGSDSWIFIPEMDGDDVGVTFSFDPATQDVKYISTNFAGGNYSSIVSLIPEIILR
jgi:hypothetical protein